MSSEIYCTVGEVQGWVGTWTDEGTQGMEGESDRGMERVTAGQAL